MKNNRDFLDKIDQTLSAELKESIKEEASKRHPDYDKLAELTDMLSELDNDDHEEEIIKTIDRVMEESPSVSRNRIVRHLVPFAVSVLLLVGVNQISLVSYGENIFSRIYHITNKGIVIHLDEKEHISPTESQFHTVETLELPTAEGDPYGIVNKCAEYGIYPLTPSYIPSGFRLVDIETENNANVKAVRFAFKRNNQTIDIEYAQYKSNKMAVEIPTDSTNIIEKEVSGHVFTIICENDSRKAFCSDEQMLYGIFTTGLDSGEADRILYSLK